MKRASVIYWLVALFILFVSGSCGSSGSSDSHEGLELGSENESNWGTPYKLSRPTVNNTLDLQFAVFGDPQPDLNMYGGNTYCTWSWIGDAKEKMERIRSIVSRLNTSCTHANCIGVVGVGDLTQHTCVQELIAFRQLFEHNYPGDDGGSIACASDGDYTRYSNGTKIRYPVYPGLGNHDDPTMWGEECGDKCGDDSCSCHKRANYTCHSDSVYEYIRELVSNSGALYDPPTTLNVRQKNYYKGDGSDIYAWEWGSYHFIHGNIWMFFRNDDDQYSTSTSKRDWLKAHLEQVIGDSGKPIVLFQHYGWDGQSLSDGWHDHNAADLINVLCRREDKDEVCNPYNVIAIFTGHLHSAETHSIHAGKDKDDNPVTFKNIVVNDSGPADHHSTGYYIVHLKPDPDHTDNTGKIEVIQYKLDYSDISDTDHYDYSKKTSYTKNFKLGFSDWDQGQPNNDGGTESCAAFKSNGRFNDRNCSELRNVACYNGSEWAITNGKHAWKDAPQVCKDLGMEFDRPQRVEEQRALMETYREIQQAESAWVNCRSGWIGRYEIPGWFGDHSEGGGITIGDIDGNGIPDLIVNDIHHPAEGGNHGYYRIGWNINTEGIVSSWGEHFDIVGWFGDISQGGGITTGDIDGNGILDLIVSHIHHPNGGNRGYYRIGLNMNKDKDGAILPFSLD